MTFYVYVFLSCCARFIEQCLGVSATVYDSIHSKIDHSILNNGMTTRLLQLTAMLRTGGCNIRMFPVKNRSLYWSFLGTTLACLRSCSTSSPVSTEMGDRGSLSRPLDLATAVRVCSPPKAVYRSGCHDKDNCPRWDSKVGPMTSPSSMLTLWHVYFADLLVRLYLRAQMKNSSMLQCWIVGLLLSVALWRGIDC